MHVCVGFVYTHVGRARIVLDLGCSAIVRVLLSMSVNGLDVGGLS